MECTISGVMNKVIGSKCSASDAGVHVSITTAMDAALRNTWDAFMPGEHSFLHTNYLVALEKANGRGLELRYVTFRDDNGLLGMAALQITHFATSPDAYTNPVMRFVSKVAQVVRLGHVHNILICGNAIATGEHGFYFAEQVTTEQRVQLLAKAMNIIAKEEKQKKRRICAMVVKDFYPQNAEVPKEFEGFGFKSFQVDHNMVMPLLPEWNSMEDYLAAMVTKFRTKAKAALTRSAALEIQNLTAASIAPYLEEIRALYENVHNRADFRLGKMNVDALPLLLQQMPEHFVVRSYHHEGRVVGFMTAMQCGRSLEAHIIGIDYSCNKEYGVYQRMLYDYVQLGIERKCERIVLGRTAAEIKSTVGAFPVDLTCAIIHQRSISNALLKLILRYVRPSEYEQRQPYKADVLQRIKQDEKRLVV
jgi:hypothetical protein